MVKHLYNKADKVVSLSKGVEKDLVSNFGLEPQKNCTIYNCYNLQKMKIVFVLILNWNVTKLIL